MVLGYVFPRLYPMRAWRGRTCRAQHAEPLPPAGGQWIYRPYDFLEAGASPAYNRCAASAPDPANLATAHERPGAAAADRSGSEALVRGQRRQALSHGAAAKGHKIPRLAC